MKELRWSYGVMTVPQRSDELRATSKSLSAAGFPFPLIFMDDERPAYGAFGAFGNWLRGMVTMYLSNPNEDMYAMFQDDIRCVRNLRQYLDSKSYSLTHTNGYFNLFTFCSNEAVIKDAPIGFTEAGPLSGDPKRKEQTGRGALALVFPNKALRALLSQEYLWNWAQEPHRGKKCIDGAVVTAMNRVRQGNAGYREYIHNPSLVQHADAKSLLGNEPGRKALSYPGDDFDATSLLGDG